MSQIRQRAPREADPFEGEPLEGEVVELPTPVPVGAQVATEEASSGTDRVVAVAMAVTVSSIAVLGVLNFLAGDDEDDEPDREGRRR